jgi:hypothetical protein
MELKLVTTEDGRVDVLFNMLKPCLTFSSTMSLHVVTDFTTSIQSPPSLSSAVVVVVVVVTGTQRVCDKEVIGTTSFMEKLYSPTSIKLLLIVDWSEGGGVLQRCKKSYLPFNSGIGRTSMELSSLPYSMIDALGGVTRMNLRWSDGRFDSWGCVRREVPVGGDGLGRLCGDMERMSPPQTLHNNRFSFFALL